MAIPEKLKSKLLVEAGHACVIWGSSRVQLHHIDGNKQNNVESNLMVFCVNHHDEEEIKKGKVVLRDMQTGEQKEIDLDRVNWSTN